MFQFAQAELVGPDTYALSLRLRGQAGTEADMAAVWPIGSTVVFLDRGVAQIDLAADARGLARHYRIGVAARGYDDGDVAYRIEAFEGIGLRPYRPAHLRVRASAGDLVATWLRRTRIDGDSWQGRDVPLGEDREAYLVQVVQGGSLRREVTVTAPAWSYPAAQRAADGTLGGATLRVAQLSDRFGPGPFAELGI